MREPAHGLGKCLRAFTGPKDFGPSGFARVLVWARDATDSRPSRSGGATVPVAAQRLRACWRAMAHRRRRFALLAIPLTPMLAHIWTRGDRRDRFSTIEKRRCDCAGGRAQAASVSAMAHRRSWFADLRDSVNSHFNLHPFACTHECNSHLCTLMTSQTVRDPSKDCFHGQFWMLTRECRARATRRDTHAVHTRTRSGTSSLCNESRPLALRDEKTAGAVTRDTPQKNVRRRHLTAIRELAR